MAKLLEYNATMVERVNLTEALSIFRVLPDEGIPAVDPDSDWFVPGQYMVLGMNNDGEPELGRVQRPMSVASMPGEQKYVEFYVR